MVVLVSRSSPPKDQEWVKRDYTADGGFLAEASASTSPWRAQRSGSGAEIDERGHRTHATLGTSSIRGD
eukprot:2899389-Pleurochrysis_carterae.AAC.1